jgi:hypothetical protein
MTDLPRTRLGRTDMSITRVGFGAWAIGGPGWERTVAVSEPRPRLCRRVGPGMGSAAVAALPRLGDPRTVNDASMAARALQPVEPG